MAFAAFGALLLRLLIVVVVIVLCGGAAMVVARRATRSMDNKKARWLTKAIVYVVVFASLVLIGANYYVYHGFGYQGDIYRHGDRQKPWVAITFDDGPSAEFTPQILDILQQYDVPATFFMVGMHVERYPEIARRVAEEGHEVGNHTWSHVNVPTTSVGRLTQELFNTNRLVYEATGEYPLYARPPRGLYDSRYRRLSAAMGQQIVLWTLSTRDWRTPVSVPQLVRRVLTNVKAGDVLLFHDSGALIRNEGGDRRATVEALPAVIEGILAKGLTIVPLSEMLKDAQPVPEGEPVILDRME